MLGLLSRSLHGRVRQLLRIRKAYQAVEDFLHIARERRRLAQCHRFLSHLIIYVLVGIYAGISVNWASLLVIPGFTLLCLNAVWIVVVLGTICARYRDFQQLVANILQVSLFLTPIFWSPDQLSGHTHSLPSSIRYITL